MSGSLFRSALYLLVGQVTTMLLGILFSAALGRTLGAGDFGTYFLVASFSAFALVVVDWGQQYFGIREVARAPDRGGELLGTGLVLRTAGTLLACVPVGASALALGYDVRTTAYAVAFVALTLPFFLAQNFGIVFRGRERMGLDAAVAVTNRAVGLVAALAALALGFGLWGVLVGQGVAGLAALLVARLLYGRVGLGPLRWSRPVAREILFGGTAIVTMTIATSIQPYIDAVVLSKLVPANAVGWYGAAKSIMGTLLAPSLILGGAAFPRLSQAAGDLRSFRAELAHAERPMVWLGGLAAVGTCFFADVAVSIVYGHRDFGPAGAILQVFGLGLFLVFVDVLLGTALVAIGRATAFSVLKIAMVAIGTALELVLVPWFQARGGNGGIGVVASFGVCELAVFAGMVALLPRGALGTSLFRDGGRALASALVTAGLLHLLRLGSPWVAIPACVALYAVCTRVTGLVRAEDVAAVRRRVARVLGGPGAAAAAAEVPR